MFWVILWAVALPIAIAIALYPSTQAARREREEIDRIGTGRNIDG